MAQIDRRLVQILVNEEIEYILSAAAKSNGILDAREQARVLMQQYPNSGLSAEELVSEIFHAAQAAGVAVAIPRVSNRRV
jgi:hypothetical protein